MLSSEEVNTASRLENYWRHRGAWGDRLYGGRGEWVGGSGVGVLGLGVGGGGYIVGPPAAYCLFIRFAASDSLQ